MNGIFNFQSGTPFSVTSGVDNSQSAINADRANLIGDPHLDSGRPTAQLIQKYFNTAAFTVNPVGTFGNAGRNILFGPGVKNIDFGIIKTFSMKERYKLQFRAEAFNLFNHPNFNNPNANVSAATFGKITAVGAPRVLQLALKAMF
jgi:hypothetical protein